MKELNRLAKEMLGKRMTKEQLKFQDELRKKVKSKEITLVEAHRIWEEKYNVNGIHSQLLARRLKGLKKQ